MKYKEGKRIVSKGISFILKGNLLRIASEGRSIKSKSYVIGKDCFEEFEDT